MSSEGSILFGGAAVCVALLGFGVWAAYHDDANWQRFSSAHACKVVGRMSDSNTVTVGPVIGGNGGVFVGVGYAPGKTGYACDDGMTYWR